MKEIEKLQAGEYYRMDDVEISEIQMRAIDLCQQINNLSIFENKNETSYFGNCLVAPVRI